MALNNLMDPLRAMDILHCQPYGYPFYYAHDLKYRYYNELR